MQLSRTWDDAVHYCYDKTVGGRKGWRLPTVEELASLIDTTQNNPALPSGHPFSNVKSSFYWSSTTYAAITGYAWFVYLYLGAVTYDDKTRTVLCVARPWRTMKMIGFFDSREDFTVDLHTDRSR